MTREALNEERPPAEGEDYYLEGGLLVFTAAYYLRRGRCCANNCRHCPYGVTEGGRVRQHEGDAVTHE